MSGNKMASLQDTYFKRLDHNIERLAENFGIIAASSQVLLLIRERIFVIQTYFLKFPVLFKSNN